MAPRKKTKTPEALAKELGSGRAAEAIVGGDWEALAHLDEEERLNDCCLEPWGDAERKIAAAIKKRRGTPEQLEACYELYEKAFLDEIAAWERSGKDSGEWAWSQAPR